MIERKRSKEEANEKEMKRQDESIQRRRDENEKRKIKQTKWKMRAKQKFVSFTSYAIIVTSRCDKSIQLEHDIEFRI